MAQSTDTEEGTTFKVPNFDLRVKQINKYKRMMQSDSYEEFSDEGRVIRDNLNYYQNLHRNSRVKKGGLPI